MRIESLKAYQKRDRPERFADLPGHLRAEAERVLRRLCARWRGRLPRWRFAILYGRAKDWVLHSRDSAWGRRMLAIQGGYARQRRARILGINPTQKATYVRVARQKLKKRDQPVRRPNRSAEDPRMALRRTVNGPVPPSPAQQTAARVRRFLTLGTAPDEVIDDPRMWPPGHPFGKK